MKYTPVYALLLMSVFCTSCGQNQTHTPKDNTKPETKDIGNSPLSNEKDIYTKYEYTDSIGKRLIIQNGFPRGGMKYTEPNGGIYNYVVFWTRIINETDNPLELRMDFPVNSYQVPSLPSEYYKVLIPPDTMTIDKVTLYNYGLTGLKSFLDNSIHKPPSSLKRNINPKESNGFYVVILGSTEGAHGTMRTGLSLKGQNLFYRINVDGTYSNTKSSDKELQCGSINLKNLVLQK